MPFKNRWRIDGTLTTRTALHVGSGDTTTRNDLVVPGQENDDIQIAAVATGYDQRAYIPGKSLKGVLRAWLDQRGIEPERIEQGAPSHRSGRHIRSVTCWH